jgi:hypothetical protein
VLVSGINGQIEFDGQSITIKRKGAMALMTQGLKGDKRIPISNIVSVQFKSANAFVNGYIQFATAASESRGGVLDAGTDENSVIFRKNRQLEFEGLRDAVEAASQQARAPQVIVQQTAVPDVADQLKKLADLRDSGVLDAEEFAQQKAKLLST